MFKILHLLLIATFFLSCPAIFLNNANAAIDLKLDYRFASENNTDEDDFNFSDFELKLDDDFYTSRFQGEYDLEANLFRDHTNNETNDQYQGNFTSQYAFLKPSLWWNLDASAAVLPIDTGVEIDEFNSQTVTIFSTGPEVSIWRGLRGSLGLSLQTTIVDYTEASLDSKRKGAGLLYHHPFNETAVGGMEISYREIDYDDQITKESNYDLATAKLFFNSGTKLFRYSLSAAFNSFDSDNARDDKNTFATNLAFIVNSFSKILFEFSNELTSIENFNLSLGNLQEAQFVAGLFLNKRAAISYQYLTRNLSAEVQLFFNRYENVVSSIDEDDELDGWVISAKNEISRNITIEASLLHTENLTARENSISSDIERDDLRLSSTYTKVHTRNLSSSFTLFVDKEVTEDTNTDNVGFRYTLRSCIFTC